MTKIEAYKAVIAGEINEEVIAKFEEQAEKVLEDGIMAVLNSEPMTASDICEAVEGINTPQKATVVVKRLVANGLASVQEVKGKSGKVKGYTLV